MKRISLLILLICLSVFFSYSQDFEGVIKYEISYINLPKEAKAMLPEGDMFSTMSIKGAKTKMEADMMGARMIIISDMETNTSISYTDVMGMKMKSTQTNENVDKIEIDLIEGETKKVAGYVCKKAIMKQPDSPDVEVYYSEQLKSEAIWSSLPQFKKLNGIPLEFQVNNQGTSMIYSAKEVTKKSLSNSVFNPPSGDYKEAPAMPKY